VTDRRRLCPAGDFEAARECLLRQARYAVEAGIDVLQVREHDLEGAPLAAIVAEIVSFAKNSATRIVVNDRLDVALAAGASGVHLRADSFAPADVRAVVPDGFLIGRSVHSVPEASRFAGSVDYLIAGTIWPTASKPASHPLLGPEGLAEIVRVSPAPVIAIGGVTIENLRLIREAGARGVAAIGMFMAPVAAGPAGGCRATPLSALVEKGALAARDPGNMK